MINPSAVHQRLLIAPMLPSLINYSARFAFCRGMPEGPLIVTTIHAGCIMLALVINEHTESSVESCQST